jgi:uridine phosphorylase
VSESGPIHLNPSAPLAERVLLPGDPGRALRLAQRMLEGPRMFNHARGLWGYTGTATDGDPLTIQSTGMGGPSAAIVIEELIDLGARVLVRAGTCGALVPELELGTLVSAREVIAADGASAALGAQERLAADGVLAAALEAAGARAVTAVSTDLFYDARVDARRGWVGQGAEVVEMEAATLLAVADRRGAAAGVLLAVSDELREDGRRRIGAAELEAAELRLGEVGCAALGATAPDCRP